MGSAPHRVAPAADLAAAAATAPVFAGPRYVMSRRRVTTPDHVGTRLAAIGFGVLSVILGLALVMPELSGFAMLATMTVGPLAAAVLTSQPRAARHARPLPLALGFALGGAAVLLLGDRHALRLAMCMPWIASALLLYTGLGDGVPTAVVRGGTAVAGATLLSWVNLLMTTQAVPAGTWQRDVFAGWPLPCYLGTVSNEGRLPTGDPMALTFDWLLMLGVAIVGLMVLRPAAPILQRWLPRLCVMLAAMHASGAAILALAADG